MKFEKFGHALKIFETGRIYVVGRFTGVLSLVLLFATYLGVTGIEFGFVEIIVLFIALNVMIFISGYVWIKLGLLDSENSSRIMHNPQTIETLEIVRKLERRLNE